MAKADATAPTKRAKMAICVPPQSAVGVGNPSGGSASDLVTVQIPRDVYEQMRAARNPVEAPSQPERTYTQRTCIRPSANCSRSEA